MSKKWTVRLLVAAAVACLPLTFAHAGAYVGVSAGQGSAEVDPGFDGTGTGFKIHGGYRVLKFFGVEADYRDFGKPDDTVLGQNVEVDTTSFDLFAVGVIPIGPSFEVFGKAGYATWDATVRASGLPSAKDDGSDVAYGIGAAYKFTKFALRFEYEEFDIDDSDSINMASVGLDFRF